MERMIGDTIERWSDTDAVSTAEKFTELRESTGMNRKDFAEYLGIPYRTMSDWEHGLRTMPEYVFSLIEYKVDNEFGLRLPQELDPNGIGNVRRGLEDQLEQNDNMLNGIIDNLPTDNVRNEQTKIKDDNANGIPDEEEKSMQEPAAPKSTKRSVLEQIHEHREKHQVRSHRSQAPELAL